MGPSVAALPRCVFCAFSRQIPLLQLAEINRNFEVFTATDFLAAITQHISQAAGGVCLATAIGPRAAAKPPRLALQGLRFWLRIRETSRGA